MIKLVILDGYAARGEDLSWDAFSALGELFVFERTPYAQIAERAADAEIVLTNKCRFDAPLMDALPKLKYIGELATGYDNIDVPAARARGITVCNVPAYSTESVVQAAFALLLEAVNRVGEHDASVKKGDWASAPDFCYHLRPLSELCGKTLGIIGYGGIGRRIKEVANAFGMRVVCFNKGKSYAEESAFRSVKTLEELYLEADIISLNCPLNAENRAMINKNAICSMKDGVIIINTARGGLVDEADVASALESGKIGAFAADVLSKEPAESANPLIGAKNCILTPHVAWATKEARTRLMRVAYENIKAFLAGHPQNTLPPN